LDNGYGKAVRDWPATIHLLRVVRAHGESNGVVPQGRGPG
jgi:hypothetical protein